MPYDREVPDIAVLGQTEDGFPELVQFEYESGKTVTAEHRGVQDRGINGEDIVYDMLGYDEPVTMPKKAMNDAYDVVERIGEREGYQDTPELIDGVEPIELQREERTGTNAVQDLLDGDIDPL